MKQIVIDWMNFCEGNDIFEDCHFYTLLMEGISNEEIEAIYKYFPNSKELKRRIKEYLFYEISQVQKNNKIQTLERLIKLDFEERKSILNHLPSFLNFNSNPQFIYNENIDVISDLIHDDIWTQDFQDYLYSKWLIVDKKCYELNNAFYGLTYDFDYQFYLFQPLLKTEYKMEYLFQFKKLGGVYVISENAVYYSFNQAHPPRNH
jgi:hypothetical protein